MWDFYFLKNFFRKFLKLFYFENFCNHYFWEIIKIFSDYKNYFKNPCFLFSSEKIFYKSFKLSIFLKKILNFWKSENYTYFHLKKYFYNFQNLPFVKAKSSNFLYKKKFYDTMGKVNLKTWQNQQNLIIKQQI